MARLNKTELQKRYPDADIDYLLMLLEHRVYLTKYEKKRLDDVDKLFTNKFIPSLRNMMAKHFGNVERFDNKLLGKKQQFLKDWNKLRNDMHKQLLENAYHNISSIYNYNRLYILWMLDETMPEIDVYSKPDLKDFVGEQYAGEQDKDKPKLYDIDYNEDILKDLIERPRYKRTTAERMAEAVAKTDTALKGVFNDALTPLSDGKGRTYLSVLKKMEQVLNKNIQQLAKRAMSFDIQGVTDDVENAMFDANDHLFNGFQCVEVLDGKTCIVCASRDGKIFKKPEGQAHPHCRAVWCPVQSKKGKVIKRKGIKGKRRRDDSFQRWFNKLPKKEQKRVLGSTKYELYQKGDLDIKELVKGNRVLTLDELAKQEAIAKLKEQVTNVDKARGLIRSMQEKLPVKSLDKITNNEQLLAYEKFINFKAEVYKHIPDSNLKEANIDKRTLTAEVKRERKLLSLKRKELKANEALAEYKQAKKDIRKEVK